MTGKYTYGTTALQAATVDRGARRRGDVDAAREGLALLWWSTFAVPEIVPAAAGNRASRANSSQLAKSGRSLKRLNLLGFL